MKIQQSEVSLQSVHIKQHEVSEKESLEQWNTKEDAPQRFQSLDRLELTEEFTKSLKSSKLNSNNDIAKLEDGLFDQSLSPKLMAIIRALESLMNKKIDMPFMDRLKKDESSIQSQPLGWGMEYHYERTEISKESLQFSAQGSVKTEDGRSIDFSLAFSMNEETLKHESIDILAGDALIDPLVLNFNGAVVSIGSVKHEFDLDLDGKSDEFSFVGSGSGFLALDKNSDGIINDGSELFGPSLGNGFNELSIYDSDKNSWIDENDDIFEQLLIWTKDENGEENLFSLKDKGVGALYLDKAETAFDLKNSTGVVQGLMKESSIYLSENGRVGTLQEIDLVV